MGALDAVNRELPKEARARWGRFASDLAVKALRSLRSIYPSKQIWTCCAPFPTKRRRPGTPGLRADVGILLEQLVLQIKTGHELDEVGGAPGAT